mmetsp:Transcript_79185/g.158141  ORF Transcript_79185/g.158141 Transcript_79185/m.158141 type:complete len:227 (-) Transcript_79185:152-832(-)
MIQLIVCAFVVTSSAAWNCKPLLVRSTPCSLPRPLSHTQRAVRRLASDNSNADPFRPPRHPLDPIIINILQRALFGKDNSEATERATKVLAAAKAQRVRSAAEARATGSDEGDWLDEDEWSVVEARVGEVVSAQHSLEALLLAATDRTPWISKYKSGGDFGLPIDDQRPAEMVALTRCECLLALWLLWGCTQGPKPVPFLDEDRLAVLSMPTPEAEAFLATAKVLH